MRHVGAGKIRVLPYIFIIGILLFLSRIIFPERSNSTIGIRAIPDASFAIGLWALTWIISIGVGRFIILKLYPHNNFSPLERAIIFSGLGFGAISLGITILGLAALLQGSYIYAWLFICSLLWGTAQINFSIPHLSNQLPIRGILLTSIIILVMTVSQALTPPWDYDGLMYHLEGMRRFLEAGRVYYVQDIWQANGPFLSEMLFAIGMSAQSDTFPKLTHLSFAILLFLGTFTFSRRFMNSTLAWTALAIMLGIAILPIWASWGYIDFSWAFYDFMAVYLFCIWSGNIAEKRLLILAGFFTGLALGTKYLALFDVLLLLVWILWESRRLEAADVLKNMAAYLVGCLLLGSPWWIKNWLFINNPIFPFVFPTKDWDTRRIALLMTYLQSFGVKRNLLNFIKLPFLLYTNHSLFGTHSLEVPSFLFPLSLIYAFQRNNVILNKIGLYSLGVFAFWFAGSQQARFLLPIFPILSILTAWVMLSIKAVSVRRITIATAITSLLVVTILYQVSYLIKTEPQSMIIGSQPKIEFLSKNVYNYKAVIFIATRIPQRSKVLQLWDGESYYCMNCVPDTDQSTWSRISETKKTSEITGYLSKNGITHILFSEGNFLWFEKFHNPGQIQSRAKKSLMAYVSLCGKEIYKDEFSHIYEITCR
jgi:hypothetical protein